MFVISLMFLMILSNVLVHCSNRQQSTDQPVIYFIQDKNAVAVVRMLYA